MACARPRRVTPRSRRSSGSWSDAERRFKPTGSAQLFRTGHFPPIPRGNAHARARMRGMSSMLANQARRFGETLVDRHVLSRDDLEHAIDEAERSNEALPAVLLRLGLVGSKDLTAALADQMGIRFVDFLDTPIHQEAPETLTPEMARKWLAVPVDFEGQKLVVAFAEPADDEALAAI